MADKMMRIAGRGKDGTAKAIQTDNNGVLLTKNEDDVKYKVIVSNKEIVAGGELTERVLAPISSDLIGFNISANVAVAYTVNLQWRLGGTSAGAGFIESETFKLSSIRPSFVPITAIKSAHLVLNIQNTGVQSALFNVQEVYAHRVNVPFGKNKITGLPVYSQSFEKDKDGNEVLRVNNINKVNKMDEPVLFGGVFAKKLIDTNEVLSEKIDLKDREEIEVFVLNSMYVPVEIRIQNLMSGDEFLVGYYDWNGESWKTHANNEAFPGVAIPHARNVVRVLSTHPDMYWLKELKTSAIKIGVRALSTPTNESGYIQVWVGGNKYVQ